MLESDEKDLSPFKVDVGHNVDQSTLLLLIFVIHPIQKDYF